MQNLFLGKSNLQQLQKVSESNIWFFQFRLNVLEGDMVSCAEACIFLALEGEAKFWITLYTETFNEALTSLNDDPLLSFEVHFLPENLLYTLRKL